MLINGMPAKKSSSSHDNPPTRRCTLLHDKYAGTIDMHNRVPEAGSKSRSRGACIWRTYPGRELLSLSY